MKVLLTIILVAAPMSAQPILLNADGKPLLNAFEGLSRPKSYFGGSKKDSKSLQQSINGPAAPKCTLSNSSRDAFLQELSGGLNAKLRPVSSCRTPSSGCEGHFVVLQPYDCSAGDATCSAAIYSNTGSICSMGAGQTYVDCVSGGDSNCCVSYYACTNNSGCDGGGGGCDDDDCGDCGGATGVPCPPDQN